MLGNSTSDTTEITQIAVKAAVETMLAVLQARMPNPAASEATLLQVRDAVKAQIDIASTVWTDNSDAYFVRRDLVNEGTGSITVTFTDPTGSAATPGAGLRPLADADRDVTQTVFDATASGTGYTGGDLLGRLIIVDAQPGMPTMTALWVNLTLGTVIAAPTGGTYERADETVGARQVGSWSVNVGASALPAGAATEATLADLLTDLQLRAAPLRVLSESATFWRVGFAEVGSGLQGLAAQELNLLQTGAGMSVNQSGGNLVITTGTTANAETVIRSVPTFTGALLARYKAILSQRIANQIFRFELADLIGEGLAYTINSATSVTVAFPTANPFSAANVGQSLRLSVLSSVGIPGRWAIASVSGLNVTFTVAGWPASGGGTLTLYGHNWLAAEYSGTTATNVLVDAQRRGWASGNTTAAINTTASPGHVGQIVTDVLTAGYADSLVASNANYQWNGRASRVENIPDEDITLYFLLVVQNGSTAPASTTTLTVGFIEVEDQPRVKVRISSADPSSSHAMPVQLVNTSIVADTELPAAAALADGAANPTTPIAGAAAQLFNGATWDRFRNNAVVTVGDTGAKTATFNGATQTNYNARGAKIMVLIGAVTGTITNFQVQLQWSPDGGTTWLNVGAATTHFVPVSGNTVLIDVYPTNTSTAGAAPAALTSSAQAMLQINAALPRTWRLAYTITGTSPSITLTNAYAAYVL